MKRLFVLLVVGALVIGAGVMGFSETQVGQASAEINDVHVGWHVVNWILIYIPSDSGNDDTSVDLGEIGPSLYDPESGNWTPLSSDGHHVLVATNDSSGFTLQISAGSVTAPAGAPGDILDRLQLSSNTLGIGGALSSTLSYTGSQGVTQADDITYTLTPSFDDVAGDYSVPVIYTATAQ